MFFHIPHENENTLLLIHFLTFDSFSFIEDFYVKNFFSKKRSQLMSHSDIVPFEKEKNEEKIGRFKKSM